MVSPQVRDAELSVCWCNSFWNIICKDVNYWFSEEKKKKKDIKVLKLIVLNSRMHNFYLTGDTAHLCSEDEPRRFPHL